MSALTSLRFFAAIYVVFHHTFVIKSFLTYISPDSVFGKLFTLGYVSVSFFFLLSGYILGVVYFQRGTQVNRRSFYLARFARVYPLFFLTLILDTPNLYFIKVAQYGQMGGLVRTVIRFFAATFMIQAWYVQWRGIDNPNWSLSAEAFFYLVFPFVGVVLWRARGASLWMAAAAVYLGGQALILLVAPHLDAETSPYLPALHLSTFMLGILLARWQTLNAKAALPGRASVGLAPNVVSVICLALFGMAVNWSSILPRYFWFDGILAPVFAGLIWSFSHSEWWAARLLSGRWLVLLGEASFGLYLIHFPVLHLFQHLGWAQSACFPLFLAISIGLSIVSFLYFEVPVRTWILKRWSVSHVKETVEMSSDAQ